MQMRKIPANNLQKNPSPPLKPDPKKTKIKMILAGGSSAALLFGIGFFLLQIISKPTIKPKPVQKQIEEIVVQPTNLDDIFNTPIQEKTDLFEDQTQIPNQNIIAHLPPLDRMTPFIFKFPPTLKTSKSSKPIYDREIFFHKYNDENRGPALATNKPGTIEVSTTKNFKHLYLTTRTNKKGEFYISTPPPGDYYWRLKGTKTVHSVIITPPSNLNIRYTLPNPIQKSSQWVWTSAKHVRYFKVEFSKAKEFQKIDKTYSTVANKFPLFVVEEGPWFLRISGLNSRTSKWEYSKTASINIP